MSDRTSVIATEPHAARRPAWRQRLVDAETGFRVGIRGDCTLFAFFFFALIGIVFAGVLGLEALEWAVLLLALGMGLSAELFHQVLKTVTSEFEHHLTPPRRQALRVGTAAVVTAHLTCLLAVCVVLWQRAQTLCNF